MRPFLILILLLVLPLASAWQWCNQTGYESCVEHTEIKEGANITSRLALNLYDLNGNSYDVFSFSGFAVRGFYADVFYTGEELYYATNLSNISNSCDGNSYCAGTLLNQTNQSATYLMADLHEEYVGCPLFISLLCNYSVDWCAWAAMGYQKPSNNTCPHIRVTECYNDIDCGVGRSCNKSDAQNWKNWHCQLNSSWVPITPPSPPNHNLPSGGGNYLNQHNSYSPTYVKSDLKPIVIDAMGTLGASVVENVELIILGLFLLFLSSLLFRWKK